MELNLESVYQAFVISSACLNPAAFPEKIQLYSSSNLIEDINNLIMLPTNGLQESIKELRLIFFVDFILEQPPSKSQYISLIKCLKKNEPELTKDHIVFHKLKSAFNKLHSSVSGDGAIDLVIQNIDLLDELKNNFSAVEIGNLKTILYKKLECAFLTKINSTQRPNPQELFQHYEYLKKYIKNGYTLINSTIKQKIFEYFNENSSDLKACEKIYHDHVPQNFLYYSIIKKHLFELFTKEFYFIVIDIDYKGFNQEIYRSNTHNIKIYKNEICVKITISSNQNILAMVLNELRIFIKLNTISQGIKFNGVFIGTYDSVSLMFDDFGEPFGAYTKKLKNRIPDNKLLYFIKEIAKDAINLIENDIVLDFLHPGNVFVSNKFIFIFPDTYSVDCFINKLNINVNLFKEESKSIETKLKSSQSERKILNKALVYSIGVIALYIKHPDINSKNIDSYKTSIATDFGENAELIQAFFYPQSTRITLEEILEIIQ